MARYLLIDFGSTFTKLTAVDEDACDIIATASHFTTVSSDISIGYHHALQALYTTIGEEISFDHILACSSAAGGLKMAAIGLVEELTVEAAKRVCLGAGAKVDLVFSHHLTKREVEKIISQHIDIILLAGGADGGNTENVLFNAKLLGQMQVKIPIVFAGNKSAQDEIEEMFHDYEMNGFICDNVMPRINVLDVKSVRDKIREIFLKNIIVAKGIKKIEEEIEAVLLPTPEAVLVACELLAKGTIGEDGIGDLVAVDIGGATTDLYSMCNASNRSDVVLHGLEEPYAKRTVEGDLGMRYSAPGIIKNLSKEEVAFLNKEQGVDIEEEVEYRYRNVASLPENPHDEFIDMLLAEMCAYRSMHRHVGRIEEVYTPMGLMYNQTGKDLSEVNYVIGTGGVVIHAKNPEKILEKTTNILHHQAELRPLHPHYLLDQDYIMAAMGLLSQRNPVLALQIMKKRIVPIKS
ncbi:MAG: methylaspartate mutase accessory protein GlmL [Candidatus Izemoplasmatales bacterium]